MNITNKLTIRHMLLNRKRTIITILGILLSVAMVTAVSGFVVSFQDLLRRDAVSSGGNWHVKYSSVSKEAADQIASESMFSESYVEQNENKTYTIFLLVKNPKQDSFEKAEEIAEKFEIPTEEVNYHHRLLNIDGAFYNQNYYAALYWFAAVLMSIIMIGSIIVISNAFYISSSERGRQFGMLISVGATKKQIRKSVTFEGLALAVIGIPLGVLLGFLVEWIALTIANALLSDMIVRGFTLRVVVLPAAVFISVIISFATILLSAWFPAKKASEVGAIDSIRLTKDVKIRSSKIKTSRLTGHIFGFEGTLAAKALKRSKSKYRATVISLVVSIVLFIGVSSFGQLFQQSANMAFEDYGINLFIRIFGNDADKQDELADNLTAFDNAAVSRARQINYKTDLSEEMLTKQAKAYFSEPYNFEGFDAYLVGIGENDFDALCKSLNLNSENFSDSETVKAILINTTGTFDFDGKKHNVTPYDMKNGTELSLFTESDDASALEKNIKVVVSGTIEEIPKGLLPGFYYRNMYLIVSDDIIENLFSENLSPNLVVSVNAENADIFAEQAEELLARELPSNSYYITNFEAVARNNRNINILVMVFVYGFIAMLSLIGVTSVIGTITTSISLRKQEFAMLQSVGMTQKGISRMLNLESLFYGVKALAFGLPIGLLVSFLLHKALGNALEFAYILPWQSMLISVIAVMLLTFSTMHYSRAKQRNNNIVDSLEQLS